MGVSQKELQKHVNKIKSMVFRIKEIKRHFLKLKERYGHDVKGIKAFNRYIERNEDLHVVERELGCTVEDVKNIIKDIRNNERKLRRMEQEAGSARDRGSARKGVNKGGGERLCRMDYP